MSKQSIIQQIASKIISLVSNHNSDSSAHQSLFNAKLNVSDAFSGDYEDLDNKPTIPTKTSDLNNDSNFLTSHQDISGKEDKSNKVTILSALSTDIQYPSAKIVYNSLSNKEDKSKKVTTLSTNSTNDEYPSAKAVYDAIQAIPSPEFVEITSNKGTASASTMKKFYVEVGNNKRDVYYTEESNGSYSWHKLDTDILDDLSIDWEDIQNKPSTMTPTSHTHTKSQITDFPTSMTPTSHTDSNGAYGKATTRVWGHTKLNSATNSTSTTESATPSAVKAAYDLANGKANTSDIPTKTSQLTNDGDGTNVFVKNNDTRLTNARTPTSHAHGSLANGGTLNSDITSVNKVAVTDSNNNLKTISKLPADKVTHQDISGKVDTSDSRLTDNRKPINNSITANSNLDNFIEQGFYYCQGDIEVAPTVTNQPLTSNQKSFVMLVEKMSATRTIQILTYYYTKDTYTRTNINGSWSTWNRIIHTGNFSEYIDTSLSTTSTNPLTNAKTTAALNKKLDLDGGTMTGNIKIPSEYESTSGATGNIPFAGHLDESSQSLTDALPTLKSLVATIKDNDSHWWSIISIRHRNGSNDGSRYGFYLKSLLSDSGDLIWNKQSGSNGTWVGERTILDSNNYSTYASPTSHNHDGTYIKTGTGTVTSTNIADKTIVAGDIADTTITGEKLANSTVTATQLASNAVETAKIKDVNVTTAKIADSAVTSAKIANKTIVNEDISDSAEIAYSKLSGVASSTHTHAFGALSSGDIDNLTEDGVYGISKGKIGDTITGTFPPTTRTNGVRSFILEQRNYSSGNYIQFAYPLTTNEDYNRIFYRTYTASNWDTWREIVQISDIDAINTALDGKAPLSHSHDDVVADGASGFMTGSDKTKLNGIATGATKNTVTNNLTSTSTTNALSAKMGNQLNTDKANKTDIIKMAFYTSNNIAGGILSSPFISVAKNSYIYIGCTDEKGNAVNGNVIVDYGGLTINLELTNGMAKIQAAMTGEFIINAWYYYLGYYRASMMAKVTVS